MKSFRSPKTEIRESKSQGHGLFSIKKIKKDEIIAIRSGHIVGLDEAMKLDQEVGDFSLQITDDHFLCPKKKEELAEIAIFINHSCNPNVGMDGQMVYVAIRDIEAGEELCLDYAMAMATEYKLNCSCGSHNCRGIVTGSDWKKKDLQKKYGKYFSSFILKRIQAD